MGPDGHSVAFALSCRPEQAAGEVTHATGGQALLLPKWHYPGLTDSLSSIYRGSALEGGGALADGRHVHLGPQVPCQHPRALGACPSSRQFSHPPHSFPVIVGCALIPHGDTAVSRGMESGAKDRV